MSWWSAQYTNGHDEYEITFGSKYKEKTKIVEKICTAIIDKLVQSEDDIDIVRHGRWVDRYGGKYANHLYECSECKGTALYKYVVDVLGTRHFVQALSDACPHCRAKMDKEER